MSPSYDLRKAMRGLAAKKALLLAAAAKELATAKEPSSDTLEHLENIDKLEKQLRNGNARLRK